MREWLRMLEEFFQENAMEQMRDKENLDGNEEACAFATYFCASYGTLW